MVDSIRATRSIMLNLPEFPRLVERFRLSPCSALSPLPGLCAPGAKGRPRPLDKILEEVANADDDAVAWALAPLAQTDRILHACAALFNAAPSPCRLYSSRRVGDHFVGMRPHMEYDRELLFPFTPEDLETWIYLQLQFSSGQSLPLPQTEFTGEQLAMLLLVADAYKASFVRSFERTEAVKAITVAIADVVQAQDDAARVRDRRWITTALNELFGLMLHPGGNAQVVLPQLSRAQVTSEVRRLGQAGHLKAVTGGGGYTLGPALTHFAQDLTCWISLISLHDIQVTGGTAESPEATEDLLVFIVTATTIWALASEGLVKAGRDLTPVRFGLRSLDMVTALDVFREFLKPTAVVTFSDGFYEATGVAPKIRSRACHRCGASLSPKKKFCARCGARVDGR